MSRIVNDRWREVKRREKLMARLHRSAADRAKHAGGQNRANSSQKIVATK